IESEKEKRNRKHEESEKRKARRSIFFDFEDVESQHAEKLIRPYIGRSIWQRDAEINHQQDNHHRREKRQAPTVRPHQCPECKDLAKRHQQRRKNRRIKTR